MLHVLVIDDAGELRSATERLLTSGKKFTAGFASNADETQSALATTTAAVVINMAADAKVTDVIGIIRKDHPYIPILLISSKGHERAAYAALKKGASSYVPHDLLEEELLPTLKDLLEYSQSQYCHVRMLEQMAEVHCKFVLENDRSLIPPLVGYLQEHIRRADICDAAELTRVGIALDEALSNALHHGNLELKSDLRERGDEYQKLAAKRIGEKPYCDRQLRVEATITHQVAEIMIHDDGPGFDPASLPDPRDPANLEKVSGRGVLLMRTFMDDVSFNEKGNCVVLRKYKNPLNKS